MKINEVVQLDEFIVKGEAANNGRSRVYLYRQKYLLLTPDTQIEATYLMPEAVIKRGAEILKANAQSPYTYEESLRMKKAHGAELDRLFFSSNPQSVGDISQGVNEVFLDALKHSIELGSTSPGGTFFYNIRNITPGYNDKPVEEIVNALSNGNVDELSKRLRIAVGSPVTYMVIDHDKKTFERVDRSAEVSTRMGGYAGKAQYILPRGDFSIKGKDLNAVLKQLANMYPDYQFADNDQAVTQAPKKLSQILAGRGPITAYHGTSEAIYKQIVKSKGMVAGKGPEYHNVIDGYKDERHYFSLDPDTVRRYAVRAAGARPYVILEVTLHDLSKIQMDEDSLWKASSLMANSKRKSDQAVLNLIPDELRNQRDVTDLLRDIVLADFRDSDWVKEEVPEYKKISNYVKYRAVTAMTEYSFSFTGSVPIKDINVYEKNKTKKYNDDNTSADDYDAVNRSANDSRNSLRNNPVKNRKK